MIYQDKCLSGWHTKGHSILLCKNTSICFCLKLFFKNIYFLRIEEQSCLKWTKKWEHIENCSKKFDLVKFFCLPNEDFSLSIFRTFGLKMTENEKNSKFHFGTGIAI